MAPTVTVVEGNTSETKPETATNGSVSELCCAEDPNLSRDIYSPLPDVCKTEPCILGIDEAGRGPALGPMVYGIAYAPVSQADKVAELGFADSKTLTEQERDRLFDVIKGNGDLVGWAVAILSPQLISSSMLRKQKYNLNMLSHDTAISLVKGALKLGANITQVRVDTVGDASKYEAKLQGIFPGIDIKVRPKADSLFPIVSAASICAKVTRDHQIYKWKFQDVEEDKRSSPEFLKYGSGYPGDQNTKKWLADNSDPVFGFNSFVRFSWSTAKKIMDEKCVPVEFHGIEDDDEEEAASNMKITQMFSSSDAKKEDEKSGNALKRCKYFSERNLQHLTAF
eukprot:Nk52_evm39s1524 gene=Nk52_evmTU39s1524